MRVDRRGAGAGGTQTLKIIDRDPQCCTNDNGFAVWDGFDAEALMVNISKHRVEFSYRKDCSATVCGVDRSFAAHVS